MFSPTSNPRRSTSRAYLNEGRESVIETCVVNRAKECGWLVRKLAWIGRRGAPDRLFMKDGLAVFVEFKAANEKPDLHQVREIRRMRAAGMTVHVIDNIADGYALFD